VVEFSGKGETVINRVALLFCLLAALAFSADFTGTWKLNAAKSKFNGLPAPKELTVTYAAQGSGWRYTATGVAANGEAINRSFTYVKDGEDIKTTGFSEFDALVLHNGTAAKSTATYKRQGKVVGKATRTLSTDGKTMTIAGEFTLPDGKKATSTSVYDKQ
jgi:hypothetical protein